MHYNFKLENFEGPLDLLLFLVRKNEIDIQNIQIVNITRQYMEYIELMKALNLDIAGDFLVMASTLMYLKSRALLPAKDEEEEDDGVDPLEDLKRQLLEYQQYKDAAQMLKEQNILDKDVFVRSDFTEPDSVDVTPLMGEVSLFDLLSALKNVMDRSDEQGPVMEVSVEHLSVKDMIGEIMEKIRDKRDGTVFEALFEGTRDTLSIITMFLALLELMKLQAIKVYQNASFSTIYIRPVLDEEAGVETELSKT